METQPLVHPTRRISLMSRLDDAIDRFSGPAQALFVIVDGILLGFMSTIVAGDMALRGRTWFNAASIDRWAVAAAIAGIVVVPVVSGFFARTWVWLAMSAAVALAAAFFGVAIGLIAARLAYPHEWANRSPDDFLPNSAAGILAVWGVIGGFCLAAGSTYHAAIGTALGKIRGSSALFPKRTWSMVYVAVILSLVEWFFFGRHL